MSLLREVAASVRSASAGLPVTQVGAAVERLRAASDLLAWVRQASADPLGVPRLADATERAEHAVHALRRAQDELTRYLTQLGVAGDVEGRPGDRHPDDRPSYGPDPADRGRTESDPAVLTSWWRSRVAVLTEEPAPVPGDGSPADRDGDPAELLRRVADRVSAGDRAGLGRELHAVTPATGLALSAVSPPLLRRLAREMLGWEPNPADLQRLHDAVGGRSRELLPGVRPTVIDAVLARICRAPAAGPDEPAHPADTAVTAGVLTGIMLARLGHDRVRDDGTGPQA